MKRSSEIKTALHQGLCQIPSFDECAFLDYPCHFNVGDHLIWLGALSYLLHERKVKINYISAGVDFSDSKLREKLPSGPIFLHGGGNLGDLWPDYQIFRERVIANFQDRPIIIFPQAIYFKNKEKLEKTSKIFNSHPDLTVVTRDSISYDIASKNFYSCKNVLAPDMAFQLLGMPWLETNNKASKSVLYQCRDDHELNSEVSPISLSLDNLVVEDWTSYRDQDAPDSLSIKGIRHIFSSRWVKDEALPIDWVSQRFWKYFHPYAKEFKNLPLPINHLESLRLMNCGVHQFRKHRLIITNRLHGHILCVLMDIPHIILPNSYHKITSFYETWTKDIPYCRLVKDKSEVERMAEELLRERHSSYDV